MSNLTNEKIEIQPDQIMTVFDSLIQEPTDAHRPHDKKIDTRLDTIRLPATIEKKNKSAHDLMAEMSLGELSDLEKREFETLVYNNLEAFSRSDADIGRFNVFFTDYKLPLKKDIQLHGKPNSYYQSIDNDM